jgi:glucosamine-6-phosphate deaminase
MRLIAVQDYDALSRLGADLVVETVAQKPDATLVLATGKTPMGMYAELVRRRETGVLDTSRVRIFQLDSYFGIGENDDRSLFQWMQRSVLDPLEIPSDHVVSLPSNALDPAKVCEEYEQAVRAAGGIDLSVLGLGPNGHLGFNEPPIEPDASTRLVDLTTESIASNARYWGGPDRVPRRALTAGMNVLLDARATLLLVSGEHKRTILGRTMDGTPSPQVPASYLHLAENVTVIADRAAWPATQM